jgi:D-arabinose 1-dehydrogenase-like Zn-dependent alcohol dehydrogenase
VKLAIGALLNEQKAVATSATGGRPAIREMLDFAARHAVAAKTHVRPLAKADAAFDEVRKGRARYRIVLAA